MTLTRKFLNGTILASGLALAAAVFTPGGAQFVPVSVAQITGLGANVATALAIAVGSAGAIVTNGGALGTPSSGTLTNATGLPIAGTTGYGTGVATALAVAVGSSGGFNPDPGAWTSYSATATCVTSTCTGTGRAILLSSKTTCVEISVTVSGSSGTITSVALPRTHANQGIAGGVSGRENGVNGLEWVGQITANSGVVSNINLAGSSSNAITSGEVITLHGCYENS